MKPVIALTARYDMNERKLSVTKGYYKAVSEVGGIPCIIPVTRAEEINRDVLKIIDGIILTGGEDLDPKYFGENPICNVGAISPGRDVQEMYMARKAIENNIPILGICRGHQILNVAGKGNLYQDLKCQIQSKDLIKHVQEAPRWYGTHNVNIKEGTKLHTALGETELRVNSFHHQAVKDLGEKFIVSAKANDGIIEAIEHEENDFCIGIQWHPEIMWEQDRDFLRVFKALIKSATAYGERKDEVVRKLELEGRDDSKN